MHWKKVEDKFYLEVSSNELDVIFKCINEISQGVRMKDSEFETRVGHEREKVIQFLHELRDVK